MKIYQIDNPDKKSDVCNTILRALPKWFGIESAIVDYVQDVRPMESWVAEVNNQIVGFISLNKHSKATAEIHVMAVLESFHRQKIGRQLITTVEKSLLRQGFRFLTVKTLSESRPNVEYDRTRLFYLNIGFDPVEEFKTLWGEENPCLLLIKELQLSRHTTLLSHVELSVSDYVKSIRFYDLILIPLGWKRLVCQKSHTTYTDGSLKIVICPVDEKYLNDGYHRKRIGLNHLAFYADSKEMVDHFCKNVLKKNSIHLLYSDAPSGDDNYYAVFFEDPDRIKLEVVYSKNYCSPEHWTNQLESDFHPY